MILASASEQKEHPLLYDLGLDSTLSVADATHDVCLPLIKHRPVNKWFSLIIWYICGKMQTWRAFGRQFDVSTLPRNDRLAGSDTFSSAKIGVSSMTVRKLQNTGIARNALSARPPRHQSPRKAVRPHQWVKNILVFAAPDIKTLQFKPAREVAIFVGFPTAGMSSSVARIKIDPQALFAVTARSGSKTAQTRVGSFGVNRKSCMEKKSVNLARTKFRRYHSASRPS